MARLFAPFLVLLLAIYSGAAFAQTPALTTNHSLVITAGGAFQIALAAAVRRSITIQNNNTSTDNCWVYVGSGSATEAKSILLTPGLLYARYYPYIPNDQIQVTCATTGDTVYVDTQ